MKKIKIHFYSIIGLCLLLTSCAAPKQKSKNELSWAAKMQNTAQSFQNLAPYIYDGEKFSDPKNTKEITQRIESFHKDIHNIDVSSAKKVLGDDPYLISSIKSLRELTSRAQNSFLRGDRKNSRILLKATTSTCFKCHTRQNLGPQNLVWRGFSVDSFDINPIEKAHILVSMRHYDQAKTQILEFLESSEMDKKFDIVYENALHDYLTISLRGQADLNPALKFVREKILVSSSPTTLHYTLKHWEKDLLYWIKNKKAIAPSLKAAKKALKRNNRENTERHLVNDLIASQILHDFLNKAPSKNQKGEAYYLLGKVYDELITSGFWDLPEVYYENCIHYVPKTSIAQKCFRRLKDNVVVGYSGSRGTLIPKQEYKRLERLRKKSGLK